MRATCRRFRRGLERMGALELTGDLRGGRSRSRAGADNTRFEALRRHIEECAACGRLSRRLDAAAVSLAEPVPIVTADPEFAGRVLARLPGPSDALGWAALRLLPAAVALILLLSWLSLTAVGSRELLFEPLDEALLMTYSAEALR